MKRFDEAVGHISPAIRNVLLLLPPEIKASVWEIRIRSSSPVVLFGERGASFITSAGRSSLVYTEQCLHARQENVEETFTRLCGYSVHSCTKDIADGFITVTGGHRAGICGTAVTERGAVTGARFISCISLRIARERKDAAKQLCESVFGNGLKSIIIAGAPLTGKTTMLRDLARRLSGGLCGKYYKTVIADERGEIAASYLGVAQNDVGLNCDVLTGYPKIAAIETALRSLSPEIIICDEIGSEEEAMQIRQGLNSGVKFAVSIHAANMRELVRKPQYKRLAESGEFDFAVTLKGDGAPCRIDKILKRNEFLNETGGGAADAVCTFGSRNMSQMPYGGACKGA